MDNLDNASVSSSANGPDPEAVRVVNLNREPCIYNIRKAAEQDVRVDFSFAQPPGKQHPSVTTVQSANVIDTLIRKVESFKEGVESMSMTLYHDAKDGKPQFASQFDAIACQLATYATWSASKAKGRSAFPPVFPISAIEIRERHFQVPTDGLSALVIVSFAGKIVCMFNSGASNVSHVIEKGQIGICRPGKFTKATVIPLVSTEEDGRPQGVAFTVPASSVFSTAIKSIATEKKKSDKSSKTQSGKTGDKKKDTGDSQIKAMHERYLARRAALTSEIALDSVLDGPVDKRVVLFQNWKEFETNKSAYLIKAQHDLQAITDESVLQWLSSLTQRQKKALLSQFAIVTTLGTAIGDLENFLRCLQLKDFSAWHRLVPDKSVVAGGNTLDDVTREKIVLAAHEASSDNLSVISAIVPKQIETTLQGEIASDVKGLGSVPVADRGGSLPIKSICWALRNLAEIDIRKNSVDYIRPYAAMPSGTSAITRFMAMFYWQTIEGILIKIDPSVQQVQAPGASKSNADVAPPVVKTGGKLLSQEIVLPKVIPPKIVKDVSDSESSAGSSDDGDESEREHKKRKDKKKDKSGKSHKKDKKSKKKHSRRDDDDEDEDDYDYDDSFIADEESAAEEEEVQESEEEPEADYDDEEDDASDSSSREIRAKPKSSKRKKHKKSKSRRQRDESSDEEPEPSSEEEPKPSKKKKVSRFFDDAAADDDDDGEERRAVHKHRKKKLVPVDSDVSDSSEDEKPRKMKERAKKDQQNAAAPKILIGGKPMQECTMSDVEKELKSMQSDILKEASLKRQPPLAPVEAEDVHMKNQEAAAALKKRAAEAEQRAQEAAKAEARRLEALRQQVAEEERKKEEEAEAERKRREDLSKQAEELKRRAEEETAKRKQIEEEAERRIQEAKRKAEEEANKKFEEMKRKMDEEAEKKKKEEEEQQRKKKEAAEKRKLAAQRRKEEQKKDESRQEETKKEETKKAEPKASDQMCEEEEDVVMRPTAKSSAPPSFWTASRLKAEEENTLNTDSVDVMQAYWESVFPVQKDLIEDWLKSFNTMSNVSGEMLPISNLFVPLSKDGHTAPTKLAMLRVGFGLPILESFLQVMIPVFGLMGADWEPETVNSNQTGDNRMRVLFRRKPESTTAVRYLLSNEGARKDIPLVRVSFFSQVQHASGETKYVVLPPKDDRDVRFMNTVMIFALPEHASCLEEIKASLLKNMSVIVDNTGVPLWADVMQVNL